jgi:hypothetical protein
MDEPVIRGTGARTRQRYCTQLHPSLKAQFGAHLASGNEIAGEVLLGILAT